MRTHSDPTVMFFAALTCFLTAFATGSNCAGMAVACALATIDFIVNKED